MSINAHYHDLLRNLINCNYCERLVRYRVTVPPLPRFSNDEYWRKPVPPWGDLSNPRIMIVGLAPAAHGGNRTGRMFTGDASAQFLFKALHACGLSNNPYSLSRIDGTKVNCVYITSVVKCAPPDNKPTPGEVKACVGRWFINEINMVKPRAIVVLGEVAWRGVAMALGLRGGFKHGGVVKINDTAVYMSYHPSPRNTNTGRLRLSDLVNILCAAAKYAGCPTPQLQGNPQA
ncbi:uracil-DNA glycosylase [Caldivirga maquilingensis]|uniref:Type-5 uracil-DNA glycosylase n=1 Tax=Caldivirga maquilingensis (strain ATCC 700844 / DSM 13496 / JCM 10307 / IC-167) TaxID=397948 RepID=A8MCZ3_CALMQ|nr:uracil-DNA glycosylase [Caldivirga maquilingensis]ABW01649.1 Uracil-DNA glycosylase superfamily [Caldivirga maquilingensis IC-167]